MLLAGLVAVQVALGVESWLRRFGAGVPVELVQSNQASDLVRSAHFFVGALLFATTVAVNLLLIRPRPVVAAAPAADFQVSVLPASRLAAGIGGTL
jgi:hypothetical protein